MMGFWDGSDISWAVCKQSAPRSREICFYRLDALPAYLTALEI